MDTLAMNVKSNQIQFPNTSNRNEEKENRFGNPSRPVVPEHFFLGFHHALKGKDYSRMYDIWHPAFQFYYEIGRLIAVNMVADGFDAASIWPRFDVTVPEHIALYMLIYGPECVPMTTH
jgi:hypothetical protein